MVPAMSATASSPPDAGGVFEPAPASQPRYGTEPPAADPVHQEHFVRAADGVALYVETWLPAIKDGQVPPARVPTVLIMTPYMKKGQEAYPAIEQVPDVINYLNARGYAVAQHHVRGTGESGGCLEQTGIHEPDDGSRVIEYLGRDAPWTDGNVGMLGISYDAETQTAIAGYGNRERLKYLKAIIPVASVGGEYEYVAFDGVPYTAAAAAATRYYAEGSATTAGYRDPQPSLITKLTQRFPCQPEYAYSGAVDGGFTKYWREHELRFGAPNITTPTLWVHGLADWGVRPMAEVGFFDRIPASTPHKGLFGVWRHQFPSENTVEPGWRRADWWPMVVAWLDRYLKAIPTGVESWPAVQVQASDGQWRVEPNWPTTGGPAGQLALGAGGSLGTTTPSGSTLYSELSGRQIDLTSIAVQLPSNASVGKDAEFTTAPMSSPLHVTGEPELDLWFKLEVPDAHIAVKIEALGTNGASLPHAFDYGYRSARHRDPFVNGAFVQRSGSPAPVNSPVHLVVRLNPTDMVVPAGGRLRLTVAGSINDSLPSGAVGNVTILHDCARPSALRFLMPRPDAPQLNVREIDEGSEPLTANVAAPLMVDGGGIATAAVCGHAPTRDDVLGPVRAG